MTLFCTKYAVALLRLQGRQKKKESIQKQKWKGERLKGDDKKGQKEKKPIEIELETRKIKREILLERYIGNLKD